MTRGGRAAAPAPAREQKRRVIAGASDQTFKGVFQFEQTSGVDCNGANDCLQPDGSGYYLVPGKPHTFYRDGLVFDSAFESSNAPWSMGPNLDWLAAVATLTAMVESDPSPPTPARSSRPRPPPQPPSAPHVPGEPSPPYAPPYARGRASTSSSELSEGTLVGIIGGVAVGLCGCLGIALHFRSRRGRRPREVLQVTVQVQSSQSPIETQLRL